MVAIPDSTVLHKSYEKKEDKLQQKFEAQGLQNCRSRNADLNFGTIRRYPEEALSPPNPLPRFREEALACECPYIDMDVFLCLAFLWRVEITGGRLPPPLPTPMWVQGEESDGGTGPRAITTAPLELLRTLEPSTGARVIRISQR
uniref:Uncharacterized protein n=1 Tax=Vitis vinifera TaxID=29760 RepID=A5BFN2_VITVI|nr:hypothetical protein VITISV_004896 [Vitis vinifera]